MNPAKRRVLGIAAVLGAVAVLAYRSPGPIREDWVPDWDLEVRCVGRTRFDAVRWRADSLAPLESSARSCMRRELQTTDVLKGADSAALVALLGRADPVPFGYEGTLALPVGRSTSSPTEPQGWLLVRLDTAGPLCLTSSASP